MGPPFFILMLSLQRLAILRDKWEYPTIFEDCYEEKVELRDVSASLDWGWAGFRC